MRALGADETILLVAGLCLAGAGTVVLRRSYRLVLVAWALALAFVPVWVGRPVIVFWQFDTVFTLLAIGCLLPLPHRWTWSVVDAVMITLLLLVLAELVLGLTTLTGTFDFVTAWILSYVFGRLIGDLVAPDWIYGAIGVVFTVVAAGALVEFVTGLNVFSSFLAMSNSLFTTWGPLQSRGGVLRAEGAFGHSIALGCSLGIAVAMTLGSRFRPLVRLVMVALMAAAALVTFSRTGMLTCAVAVVLTAVFGRVARERWLRPTVLALMLAGGAVFWFVVRDVFAEAGDESTGSASYRRDLLALVADMAPFGVSDSYTRSTTGVVSVGSFRSIDNAALLLGLTYGWVVLVVIVVLLGVTVALVVRGRAEPPVIALVAQLPAFVTVALITQYASFVWFTAGLAVAVYHARKSGRTDLSPLVVDTPGSVEELGQPYHLAGAENRSSR